VNDTRLKKSGIRLINEEMEEIVKKELSRDDSAQIVQYWICCSPVVNQKLIKIFDSKRIP
jgi:ribosomal protein S3AE